MPFVPGRPKSAFLSKSVIASLLLLSACGPVAIGAAIGSGGGGGGPAGPASPTLAKLQPAYQPDADRTIVGVKISQAGGRQVRLRLEYDIGQGRVRVPMASLVNYDVAGRQAAPALPNDSNDNLLVTASRAGTDIYLSWNHAADLGQVERRGVTLFAVFSDALLSAPDFASDGANSVQLLGNQTVGRELGQLSDLVLRRQSTDPESAFVVDAVLQDRGGDRESTGFSFEYALTEAAPQAGDYIVLPPTIPTAVVDTPQPDGSIRSTLSFAFDPLSLGVPFGDYPNFWVRLQSREVYPQERSDIPQSVLTGPLNVLQLTSTQVGYAPRIDSVRVVNPGSAQSNAGDPGKPWLRLPISVSITNPSPTREMRVRLRASYELDNATFPCTAVHDGDPQTDAEFTLAKGERRRQFVIWNVAFDEGLGNRLVNDFPYSTPRLAQVAVEATRIELPGTTTTLAGNPLRATAPAGQTLLSTNPFVDFRENLLAPVGRVWSAGDEATQATRDLFFTRYPPAGGGAQETTLGLNQQFEPLQITPPPPDYNFLAATPPVNNGVYDLIPTDFDPDVPDCLVWIDGSFRYVRWPGSAGAVVEQLGPVGAFLARRGRDPVTFTLGSGSTQQRVAVFHTWDEQTAGGNKTVTVRLTAVSRSLSGWAITTGPVETFLVNGTPSINISAVGGEFDADGSTYELVLGTLGTEQGSATRPGLLHRWVFSLSGSQLEIGSPVALATMPPPTGDPTRNVSYWLMANWRDDAAARDALVVVRQLDGTASLNRELDVWVLRQNAGGGLQSSWTLLTSALSARPVSQGGFPELGITSLRRVFTKDLDGGVDGIVGSDLLLVFERRDGATNQKFADVWLFARRAARPAQWRRIIKNLEVLQPDTLLPYTPLGGQVQCEAFELVDVNGDRLLDLLTAEQRLLPPVPPFAPQPDRDVHYNYLASSLSGVAGKLRNLGPEAGSPERRSVLPGLLDADGDGNTDVVTGGLLLLGSPDGTYTQARSLAAGPLARHRIERLFLDAPADSIEVIVGDESINAQNRVYRIGGMGAGLAALSVTTLFDYSFGVSGDLLEVRTLTAPDTAVRRIKDLVGLVRLAGVPGASVLRRGRVEGTGSQPIGSALWSGQVATAAGLALVRRSPIPLGSTTATEIEVQDIVVADAQVPGRIQVFESHNGYLPRSYDFPGENVLRIAEGSIDGDELEDLCVLTQQGGTYRVRCLQQSANPALGIGQPAALLELARFQQPFTAPAATAVRALQFDRGARRFAQGFLLLDEDLGGSQRSEVRLLRPIGDAAGLALRMVRSPVDQAVDLPVDTVVADFDRDQLIEVFGGQRSAIEGLQRLQTNVAPQ